VVNDYNLEKQEGITRVLFVGDSVVLRCDIIHCLKDLYGESDFEYWNAGVNGFNTAQEIEFFKQFNYMIRPDLVILLFHNIDFETTPVAFIDESGSFSVYAPEMPTNYFHRWLFRHSYLFRSIVSLLFSRLRESALEDPQAWQERVQSVQAELRELKQFLERDRVRFSVVILPIIDPPGQWSWNEIRSFEQILFILNDLHIRYFDLLPVITSLVSKGYSLQGDVSDRWHPTPEVSCSFAQYLYNKGLFDSSR